MENKMNTLKRCAGVGLLIFFALIHPALAQSDRGTDEAAIRDNVKQMEAGWNAKSGALFAKPFAEDADYVIINGNQIKGHAEIEQQHQRIFDTIFKDTTLTLNVKQTRFLRPDVAVVHVSGRREAATKELTQDAVMTMIMVKEKQGWKIAAFQNTAVVSR
jgi:uncharacterized protein (TIGR02246 family)